MWCLKPNVVLYKTSRRKTMLKKGKTDHPGPPLDTPVPPLDLPKLLNSPKDPTAHSDPQRSPISSLYWPYFLPALSKRPNLSCHPNNSAVFTSSDRSSFNAMMLTLLAGIDPLSYISMLTWDEKVILMKKNVPWPALGFFGTFWWWEWPPKMTKSGHWRILRK